MNQPADAPQKSSSFKWILIGCGGCAFAGLLAVVAIFGLGILGAGAIMKAAEPAKEDARTFLAQAEKGEIDAAYAHFSKPLQEVLAKPAFQEMVEKNPEYFHIADSTFNSVSFTNDQWTIRGHVTSKSGKNHNALFRYMKEDGTLKLLKFRITDEELGEHE